MGKGAAPRPATPRPPAATPREAARDPRDGRAAAYLAGDRKVYKEKARNDKGRGKNQGEVRRGERRGRGVVRCLVPNLR